VPADGLAKERQMNIHEYQAKALLRRYRVTTPRGEVVYTSKAAARVAEELGGQRWVVKAQIHAGGRGKAGGVKIGNSPTKIAEIADLMLGSTLVTAQTGSAGQRVSRVLVERASRIEREFYLSMVVDRDSQRIVVVASAEGGVDIEDVAASTPDAIHKEYIDPGVGLVDFQCRKVATAIGLGKKTTSFTRLLKRMYRLFRDLDCLMLEVNPFIETEDGELVALDAKMSFDDNALFRQGDVVELRDFDEEDPKEVEAIGHGLNYIALDGSVGCIVNGAGLAMGTMDAIAHHGGRPANFLDVGGGASPEKIANAFRIVLQDPNVKAILVNIFAGINRCDWIAAGVVLALKQQRGNATQEATRDQELDVPVVVRLAGTNVAEGRAILDKSGLELIQAADLDDAAAKAVAAARDAEGVSA
jgi:malate-CoA ligase subunit beta